MHISTLVRRSTYMLIEVDVSDSCERHTTFFSFSLFMSTGVSDMEKRRLTKHFQAY